MEINTLALSYMMYFEWSWITLMDSDFFFNSISVDSVLKKFSCFKKYVHPRSQNIVVYILQESTSDLL